MVRRVGVKELDFGALILGQPLIICNCSVQMLKNKATLPTAFPNEFLPHVTQVFQSNFIQDISEVFHWRFAPWAQTTLLMRPQDFIEIPSA